ncbi:hypothetical protein KGA66_01565 [Actinocrinis puniceicyclus]|uniref:Uncharacterized protein n=1 Tax=Actinocrinis puniceicyclus TaxID=977794 RepID=A0A8J8B9D2_9ACTN|nr:hypothetical protein [Actinocrinis puniceicyclus]MBS2961717.1 hypothetical protein [Actinocrinis puniceicyclus]
MGLEIEFDYDDTEGGRWSAPSETQPLRARVGRRWNAGLAAGNPLFVHLGIALAALVLGAASTAGFTQGRQAARDRAATVLHLAPVGPFVIDSPPSPPTDVRQLLATPWTDAVDEHVTLRVVNDGPDPVTVLGAQVTASQFAPATLLPAAPGGATAATTTTTTAPGGVSALGGVAHFVCGDFPSVDPVATVARLTVRTADGGTRSQTLMIDRFSDIEEQRVCQRMPEPGVITSFGLLHSKTRGTYTVLVGVTNRAPFPLLVWVPADAVTSWRSDSGLDVRAPAPVSIPPRGSANIAIPVSVVSCALALESAQGGYGYDSLAFADFRDGPHNARVHQTEQGLALAAPDEIAKYCGLPELPGIGGGGSAG